MDAKAVRKPEAVECSETFERLPGVELTHAIIESEDAGRVSRERHGEAVLGQAEQEVARAAGEFREDAVVRTAAMRFAFERLAQGGQPGCSKAASSEIAAIHSGASAIHEVAATYGLRLADEITLSLLQLTGATRERSTDYLRAIDGHLLLLEIVLRENLGEHGIGKGRCIEEALLRLQVVGGQADADKEAGAAAVDGMKAGESLN